MRKNLFETPNAPPQVKRILSCRQAKELRQVCVIPTSHSELHSYAPPKVQSLLLEALFNGMNSVLHWERFGCVAEAVGMQIKFIEYR